MSSTREINERTEGRGEEETRIMSSVEKNTTISGFKKYERIIRSMRRKVPPSRFSSRRNNTETGEVISKEIPNNQEILAEVPKVQPSVKRLKMEQPSQFTPPESQSSDLLLYAQLKEVVGGASGSSPCSVEIKNITNDASLNQWQDVASDLDDSISLSMEDMILSKEFQRNRTGSTPSVTEIENATNEISQRLDASVQPTKHGPLTMSIKTKIEGICLTEVFSNEEMREHVTSLRQWVGQCKSKPEKQQAIEPSIRESSCQFCTAGKLTFKPTPVYCSLCGYRIKRNAIYYTVRVGGIMNYICTACYYRAKSDSIVVKKISIPKTKMQKVKNHKQAEESWVKCSKCETWQHKVCALFNRRWNDGSQAEYTCPRCFNHEIKMGELKQLPQSAVLGAKALPRTLLSDHIEERLLRKLKQDRQQRAKMQRKTYDEVPGAQGLVVRVVSSIEKILNVNPKFRKLFRQQKYPTTFPYESKAVLLFEKIEGVEVCIFGMYVQEFGSECQPPNQRHVNISHLDSVKYFRPEVKAATGEALRTFVYHETLIGYLEYCKMQGFTRCYIWACPPPKGEDFIMYCHPEVQRTPNSDSLRDWFLSMLRKAALEEIVVKHTNLYNQYFVQTAEGKAKVTSLRLPYFDSNYCSVAIENTISEIYREEKAKKHKKKGALLQMTITKQALSSNEAKDGLLMHRVGKKIAPYQEDFIVVHLQHECSHCGVLMVSGNRWICDQCEKFQLCDNCYESEQKHDNRERHPVDQEDSHALKPVEITGFSVPRDMEDNDEKIDSDIFDSRQDFLSLCQNNHYQFDTLRHAKFSSMMILYHLHNPAASRLVRNLCNICHLDIVVGHGWRCKTCPDYEVCHSCYQRDGGLDHPHKMMYQPASMARQCRHDQLQKTLDELMHASQCHLQDCQHPHCQNFKELLGHGKKCKTHAIGGCESCKSMWFLLRMHARACKGSKCHVPRCRDLKELLSRQKESSDFRQRKAVMEMMRQRAAELAADSSLCAMFDKL